MRRVALLLSAIKFSHSVFALPFALLSAFLAAGGPPPLRTLAYILLAAVGARTAAMAFNRILDRRIDAQNPRTAMRELPSGRLTVLEMALLTVAGALALVGAAYQLNRLCFQLAGPTLLVVLGYSATKRFTAYSHLVLGLALGIAPIGAWIAVRGGFAILPLLLGAAVVFWVAGFDVIYALQDEGFDRAQGLHSLPARLGAAKALALSRAFHAVTVLLLLAVWYLSSRGPIFLSGVIAAAVLLAWEQSVVKADDLSRLDAAFFTANGLVSVVLFLAGALDLALG